MESVGLSSPTSLWTGAQGSTRKAAFYCVYSFQLILIDLQIVSICFSYLCFIDIIISM